MIAEKRAVEVLRQAEAKLRELVSEAAQSGDYAGVVKIAAWAKSLGVMEQDFSTSTVPNVAKSGEASATSKRSQVANRLTQKEKPRHIPKTQYPRFFREGNHLARIAWSKRQKKEYRHKAPYTVLQTLVKVMAECGKDGRIFSTEDFLPIRDSEGAEVPSYQAYVGIALLKQVSLIDQHGRQGYSIPRFSEFNAAVEAIWQKLPIQ